MREELERTGEYIHEYKSEGYYCWTLEFRKTDDVYSVEYHLSTESGREEELDYFESKNFDNVMNYAKENYDYE